MNKVTLREAQILMKSILRDIDNICRENDISYWIESGLSLIHIQMCIRDRYRINDFNKLINSENLFARKCDSRIDKEIINEIFNYLLRVEYKQT